MRFGSPFAAAKVTVWALWGTISPRSLRWLMRRVSRIADANAARKIPEGQLIEWRLRGDGDRPN